MLGRSLLRRLWCGWVALASSALTVNRMSTVRVRVWAVAAAAACVVSVLAGSAVPAAAEASGGAIGGGRGYSGGGVISGPGTGKPLTCFEDLSSTVNPYKRAYKAPDPRCEMYVDDEAPVYDVTNAYVACNLGYQVWRFYGTKENPAAYTTMSEVNVRTRKAATQVDTVCPGAGVSKAASEADADSMFWTWAPNPWDAKVGSSNVPYVPPQGESVWNVRTGFAKDGKSSGCQKAAPGYKTVDCNSRGDVLYGSFAFTLPSDLDQSRSSRGSRPSASPSGSDSNDPKSSCVIPQSGKIKVFDKECPLQTGELLYDSAQTEPVPVTINGKTVQVKSCLDLTAERLTRPGGPYAGQLTSAKGMLEGGTSIKSLPWSTWSPDKKASVEQQAREFVQSSVVGAFLKLTTQPAQVLGKSVNLTPAYASAILGLSAALDTRLAVGDKGVNASKVTPETMLFQGPSVNKAAPCGSAFDFALYSIIAGEQKTLSDGSVVSVPVSSRARRTALARSRDTQIRTGFCVAPIIQYAWILTANGSTPAKWNEVLPEGTYDQVLYHRELRYGKKKVSLSTLKLQGENGPALVQSTKNDVKMNEVYAEAIAKSMRAVYKKDPKALPLGWWAPKGTVYQSAEGLASPPSSSSIEDRIEGATNAMNCVTSYFDNGVLVVDPARTPPPETDCVPGVDPECTPTEVEEVTEIVGSPTPVRVDLAIDRGLSARGTFETYTARVANVSLWCGTRLCNHAANPLDPTLVSATGRLTLDVAGEKASEFRQCQTINQGNCDYFIKSQPSGGSLRGQTLQVVFFSPTPEGVVVRPVLESTAASEQTYKRKYKTITTCVPVPAPKPSPAPSGVKAPAPRPGTAATPAPSASQSCTSRTVEDGYQPDKVVSVAVSFSTPGGGNRVVSGAIGGT